MCLLESEALCNTSWCTVWVDITFSVSTLCVQPLPSSVGHLLCSQPKGVPCCCDTNVLNIVLSWIMWLSLRRCEDRCPEGKHGEECLSECRCQNGGTCNPTSGKCYCTPGWTVSFRLQACTIVVILWIIIPVFIEIWVFKKKCNLPII